MNTSLKMKLVVFQLWIFWLCSGVNSDRIHTLPELNVKSQLSKLEKLSLREVEIYAIERKAFTNMSKLVQLDLYGNKLATLYRDTFEGLISLKNLNLGNNEIRYMAESIWQPLVSLVTLDLSNNSITTLRSTFIKYNRELRELHLENNPLVFDDHGPILQSDSLHYLYLQGCRLKNLPSAAFHKLLYLKQLDLSGNHLQVLPEGLLKHQHHLEYLDISYNSITHVAIDVFHSPIPLAILDCEGNPLKDAMNCDKVHVLVEASGRQEKGSSIELDKRDGKGDSNIDFPMTGQEGKDNVLDNTSKNDDKLHRDLDNTSFSDEEVEKHGVVQITPKLINNNLVKGDFQKGITAENETKMNVTNYYHNVNYDGLISFISALFITIPLLSVVVFVVVRRYRAAGGYVLAETRDMP